MRLLEKLDKLRRLEDTVTYRWTAGRRRIADGYVNLSDLRLCCISKSGDSLTFSSAAPVLAHHGNRQQVLFSDSNMISVTSGPRTGMTMPTSYLHDDETATEAPCCCHRLVDDSNCPDWLAHKIVSMGSSMIYSAQEIETPQLFRLSRNVEALKPVITTKLRKQLGLPKDAPVDDITDAFHESIDLLGQYTDSGYIVPFELVSSGGMIVASAVGISKVGGSAVYRIPLSLFKAEASYRKWTIHTSEDTDEL